MRKKKKRTVSAVAAIIALVLFFSPGTLMVPSLMPVAEAGSGSGTAGGIGLDLVLNPLKPLLGINLSKSGVSVNLNLLDYLELKLGLSLSEKLELSLRLHDIVDLDLSLMDLLESPELLAALTRAVIEVKGFRKIHAIQYPLSTLPAIVKAGEELLIELNEDPGSTSGIKITLAPSFAGSPGANAITLEAGEVAKAPSRYWVGELAREVYSIRVKVPSFEEEPRLQECLYDLEVSWNGGRDSQRRAVKVIKEYKEDFNYVVMADVHVGFEIHSPGRDSVAEFKKAIEEINLLNPEFVLLCGDIVCAQSYPGQYGMLGADNPEEELWFGHEYERFYHYLQMFEVPVYLVPGNHDGYTQTTDDGREYWQAMIGPYYYSFNYGDIHFVGLDTYQWSQLDRLGAGLL
ncbi:MAG: hypothetical protein GX210_05915, partial [Firmicutes bacterium]|nr:hypothetical protein [Bacillota bacterium]